MNDAEYRIQKRRIERIAKKWVGPLGLSAWEITIRVEREPLAVSGADAANNWQAVGESRVKWEYMKATILFNAAAIAEYADGKLERMFVHECCHILVAEMREWSVEHEAGGVIGHEERVVSGLVNALFWTRAAGKAER